MGEGRHPHRTAPRPRWRTRANALTSLRLLAAPLCAIAIATGAREAALVLFVLAVATDWLDGRVARRYGESSALGGLLDHASDALFVALGLFALALRLEVPLSLPVLVLAAFVQYAVDSRAPHGGALRASRLGRWNGIAYFVLLGIPVVRDGLALPGPPSLAVRALGYVLVATTLLSMADRALAQRRSPSE